jgi:hypothetical protein
VTAHWLDGPIAELPVGLDELRALYDGLWDAGVDHDTLELCRLRQATLIGTPAEPAVDAALVEALPSWPSSPLFTEAQRAALAFAEQYVIDPHGFADTDGERLRGLFTPEQLATLTIAVATFDALARARAVLS